jgi:hypothetical protein
MAVAVGQPPHGIREFLTFRESPQWTEVQRFVAEVIIGRVTRPMLKRSL